MPATQQTYIDNWKEEGKNIDICNKLNVRNWIEGIQDYERDWLCHS